MRIFVALDLTPEIRQRLERFVDGVENFAPPARWVRPESLHVTLKFIGEKNPESEAGPELAALAKQIDEATAAVRVARENHPYSPHLTLARAGSARAESRKSAKDAASSGVPHWQKSDGPNQRFAKLQERLGSLLTPEFGTMAAREFFLYESQLLRGGSRYTKIGQFTLIPQA